MDPETRVLVCGSRNWDNPHPIREAIKLIAGIEGNAIVIHGAAPGADRIAGAAAKALDLDVWEFPADWEKDGKAAGPARNAAMIALKPHAVVCFSMTHPVSPGSADMCRRATEAGIPIFLRVAGRRWRYYPPKGNV